MVQGQTLHLIAFDFFSRWRPSFFDDKGTKMDTDNWIEYLDKIFYIVTCTKKEKVEFVSYNLSDVAGGWWKATYGLLQQELGKGTPFS